MTPALARLGYHYIPDDQHYRLADLEAWLPALQTAGARWLTLRATLARGVPEPFIAGLRQAGIEPIVHIGTPVRRLTDSELTPLLASYAAWGVRYVVVFDRPNLRAQWPGATWSQSGLIDRFLDALMPVLAAQKEAGLTPILPPLEPAGDYWDTAFLSGVLEGLARRGPAALLDEASLAIYAWTYGKKLNWGAGGPMAWPESRPYHTPEGSQDQRGLHAFEWYHAAAARAGYPGLPMLVVAGGALRASNENGADPDQTAEDNLAIARALSAGDIPDYVLNFNFYPLAAADGHPDEPSAWFSAPDAPRPPAQAIVRLLAAAVAAPHAPAHVLSHYVLLDLDDAALGTVDLAAVYDLVGDRQASIGVSPEAARLAAQVTVLGNAGRLPADIESTLTACGCQVRRLASGTKGIASALFAAPAEARGATSSTGM